MDAFVKDRVVCSRIRLQASNPGGTERHLLGQKRGYSLRRGRQNEAETIIVVKQKKDILILEVKGEKRSVKLVDAAAMEFVSPWASSLIFCTSPSESRAFTTRRLGECAVSFYFSPSPHVISASEGFFRNLSSAQWTGIPITSLCLESPYLRRRPKGGASAGV